MIVLLPYLLKYHLFSVLNTNPLEYNNDHRLPVKKSSKKLIKKPIIVGFGQTDVLGLTTLRHAITHHSKMQKDGWAKYIPNFGFK